MVNVHCAPLPWHSNFPQWQNLSALSIILWKFRDDRPISNGSGVIVLTDKHANRHYWKQYHPRCVAGNKNDQPVQFYALPCNFSIANECFPVKILVDNNTQYTILCSISGIPRLYTSMMLHEIKKNASQHYEPETRVEYNIIRGYVL